MAMGNLPTTIMPKKSDSLTSNLILFHALEQSEPTSGTKSFMTWNKVFQRQKQLKQCGLTILVDHFLSYL